MIVCCLVSPNPAGKLTTFPSSSSRNGMADSSSRADLETLLSKTEMDAHWLALRQFVMHPLDSGASHVHPMHPVHPVHPFGMQGMQGARGGKLIKLFVSF